MHCTWIEEEMLASDEVPFRLIAQRGVGSGWRRQQAMLTNWRNAQWIPTYPALPKPTASVARILVFWREIREDSLRREVGEV